LVVLEALWFAFTGTNIQLPPWFGPAYSLLLGGATISMSHFAPESELSTDMKRRKE